jgi:hypothetical protein
MTQIKVDPRNGAPKRTNAPAIHSGMGEHQKAGAGVGGMGHATAAIAGGVTIPASKAAAPLAHAYGSIPKSGKPAAQPVPGQRSRTKPHDPALGEAILNAAFDASAPDDCRAHGRVKS